MKIEKRLKLMNDKMDEILSLLSVQEKEEAPLLCEEVKTRRHKFLTPLEKKALNKDGRKLCDHDLVEKYGVSLRTVKRILND